MEEDRYCLTPRGFFEAELGDHEGTKLYDALVLYMRRIGFNAMIIDDGLEWGSVEKK